MKCCPKCKIEKNKNEFGKNKIREDGLQRICKLCMKEEHKKSYNKDKEKYYKRIQIQIKKCIELVDNFKKKSSCVKCGEKRYWILDFHHKNPNEKKFDVGSLRMTGSTNKIKTEIEKCVLLCKNCHYDFHHNERQNNITLEIYLLKPVL